MSFLKEIGFDTFLDFLGFTSNVLYVLTPIIFNMLIDHDTFEIESISILSIFSMYCNAFIYFFLGLFGEKSGNDFVLRDYCNLVGTFLGLVYLSLYFFERYKDESIKKLILYYLLIAGISAGIIVFEYVFIISNYNDFYKFMFKWVGVFPNILEYFPIGLDVCYLLKNKKSNKFLIVGGTFGLFNSVVWLVWAIKTTIAVKDDPQYHSICANFLSVSMIFLQFYIFWRYKVENKEKHFSVRKIKYD